MNLIDMSGRVFTQVVQASFAAVILGIIVLVLERLLRRRLSPAWLFALYLPVLVRLLMPVFPEAPTSIFNFPKWVRFDRFEENQTVVQVGPRDTSISALENSATPLPVQSGPSPHVNASVSASAFSLMQILSLAWLGVTLALLLRIAGGAWRLQRKLQKESMAATELDASLAELGGQVRPRSMPKVIETTLVDSPCLFGFFRPRILLPVGLSRRLTSAELSHVLLHELAHLRRADLVVNALMTVAQAIHWFNPFVWLLFRRMRLQRELACDRWVLETLCADAGEARAYGETLLKLIQEYTPRTSTPSLVGILESEQSAKARLRQIAAFQRGGTCNRTAGVFVLLMLATIGLSNAQTEKVAAPSGEVPEPSQSANRIELKTKTSAGIQMLE
ncbi:MAG: M56 family metallopeptidase, partial [Limisphaerales bacterium]